MSDNRDYWSKLLGDSFDDDLYSSVLNTPDAAQPQQSGSAPGEVHPLQNTPDDIADTARFVEFDLSAKNSASELKVPDRSAPPDHSDIGDEDFDIDFDFEGEYSDAPSNDPIRIRRHRRTGCIGGILYAAFVICVSLVLAAMLWMAATDVLALNKPKSDLPITVPDDYTIEEVAEILHENGVIKYKGLFKLYCRFSDSSKEIAGGTYTLNTNYDYRAIVVGLTPGQAKRVEVDVTIPEGYTLLQIFELLEENDVCTAQELWDTAANHAFEYEFLDNSTLGDKYRLEGYLFPDTYKFYVDDTPTHVINKFLSNFENKFIEEYALRAEELGYTINEVLTIAAMIEKEAAFDAERDAIASVIYNRLNSSSFPYLQIDATIYYGISRDGGTRDDFSTEYDNPYNTYMYQGLPPGPISNPGLQSIRGALYPQDTSYYYYALSVNGGHEFFTNYDSFLRFVKSDEYSPG